MSPEGESQPRRRADPLRRVRERLMNRFSDFEPAHRHAPEIPREGFYQGTHPNLSVAPSFHTPHQLYERVLVSVEEYQDDLVALWARLCDKRVAEYLSRTSDTSMGTRQAAIENVVFAPNSDVLFNDFIARVVSTRIAQGAGTKMLVPEVGYPLPFSHAEALRECTLIEGKPTEGDRFISQLDKYVVLCLKLPSDISAVYIDYPSTIESHFGVSYLVKFIRKNPKVLFIVDQANAYFTSDRHVNVEGDMSFALGHKWLNADDLPPTDDCLVFVTNTTSKYAGSSGSAVLATTTAGRKLLTDMQISGPQFVGFTHDTILQACQTVALDARVGKDEKFNEVVRYRLDIDSRRRALWEFVRNVFGVHALPYPYAQFIGPHLFVDATALGFADGQSMTDFLASAWNIGTKTAIYYGDTDKHPELKNQVYIGIPAVDEDMKRLMEAMEAIKAGGPIISPRVTRLTDPL